MAGGPPAGRSPYPADRIKSTALAATPAAVGRPAWAAAAGQSRRLAGVGSAGCHQFPSAHASGRAGQPAGNTVGLAGALGGAGCRDPRGDAAPGRLAGGGCLRPGGRSSQDRGDRRGGDSRPVAGDDRASGLVAGRLVSADCRAAAERPGATAGSAAAAERGAASGVAEWLAAGGSTTGSAACRCGLLLGFAWRGVEPAATADGWADATGLCGDGPWLRHRRAVRLGAVSGLRCRPARWSGGGGQVAVGCAAYRTAEADRLPGDFPCRH